MRGAPVRPPPRQWTWRYSARGDVGTGHCDLLEDGTLDWYGDSTHPLWKGWFGVGRQSIEEFLLLGAPEAAAVSAAARRAIGDYLRRHGWRTPRGRRAAALRARARAARARAKAAAARAPARAPRPPAPPPWEKATTFVEIIGEIQGWPATRLADVSLSLGTGSLYEAHTRADRPAAILDAGRLLLWQGPLRPGRHTLRLSGSLLRRGSGYQAFHLARRGMEVRARKPVRWTLALAPGGARLTAAPLPGEARRGAPRLVARLEVAPGSVQRLAGFTAWLDDVLLADVQPDWPFHAVNRRLPSGDLTGAGASDLVLFDGPVAPGAHRLAADVLVAIDGEADPRQRHLVTELVVAGAEPAAATLYLPPESPLPAPEQAQKLVRLRGLEGRILDALRAGATFDTADKEGGWEQIRFEGGRFVRETGSYVGGGGPGGPGTPLDEPAVLRVLVEHHRYEDLRRERDALYERILTCLRPPS